MSPPRSWLARVRPGTALIPVRHGLGVGPLLSAYATANGSAILWQAAGATALFVGAFGAYGYATRCDLSSWARTLFWALLGLIVFGLIGIFVSIPSGDLIYSIAGLAIF